MYERERSWAFNPVWTIILLLVVIVVSLGLYVRQAGQVEEANIKAAAAEKKAADEEAKRLKVEGKVETVIIDGHKWDARINQTAIPLALAIVATKDPRQIAVLKKAGVRLIDADGKQVFP